MSSNGKIENMKIRIRESGFPLEMFTHSVLKSQKYKVISHQYYEDPVTEKYREIDLIAEKIQEINFPKSGTKIFMGNKLIIECKKQDEPSPWLFFEGESVNTNSRTLLHISPKNRLDKKYVAQEVFPKTHYYNKIPCIYYIQPFKLSKNGAEKTKNKNDKDHIYDAVFQLFNATMETQINDRELIDNVEYGRVYFYYPIIVLDGELYSSAISDIDKIDITPQNHVQLHMNFQMGEADIEKWGDKSIVKNTHEFIIDIVKKEYLNEFLETIYNF